MSRLRKLRRRWRRRFEGLAGGRRSLHAIQRMSTRQWLLRHQREVVFEQCRWMGVPALKNPLDAWIYQEILHEVRPELVVEIGSFLGGSTLFLAHMLDLIGSGSVLSVDVDHSRFAVEHPRIETLTGDSTSAATLDRVAALARDARVLVIHDADHRSGKVLEDLEAYAPFVSVGSYLIVEDGIVDLFVVGDGIGIWDEGPLCAVEKFLPRHPEFEVDASRERYLLTYNPRGFLRRTR